MRRRLALFLLLVLPLLAACAGARRPDPAKARIGVPVAKAHDEGTRYRAGDRVVYEYSGSLLRERVVLREEIVSQRGNRLVIDVVAARGDERRHWQQLVTDTKENEANNVVDELWVLDGDTRRRLANEKNADLLRLYEWTLLAPDGSAQDVKKEPATLGFAGSMHACERTSGRNTWRGRPVRFESYDCADFLWTHGPARFWDDATNETLLVVDVERADHETLCDYGVAPSSATCAAREVCAFVERGRSACVPYAEGAADLLAPFRAGQTFACTQGARSAALRSHSFTGDIFATDLAPVGDRAAIDVVAPISGEAFVFDTCEERDDRAKAHNSSPCGLGYGNHVKIWDGTTIVLLGHLARATITNGPVKRGDPIGVAGVSGAAGQRHVHVTVSRPGPKDDARKLLTTPGFKGPLPVLWRIVASGKTTTVDELACADDASKASHFVASAP